jgi:hypothetical protein
MKPSTLSLILFVLLTCFALSPRLQAVNPPPDGGYPGGNTAEGNQALFSLNGGLYNTANGTQTLYSNTTGNANTATGYRSLFNATTAINSTGTGFEALYHMNNGGNSTATGYQALYSDNGCCNTATGSQAMFNNTSGGMNTATGWRALFRNITGGLNTADGIEALRNNSSGESNTATGYQALYSNTTGNFNTAIAYNALHNNTTGSGNTAVGADALSSDMTGDNNVALGTGAFGASRTGSRNIGIGHLAGQFSSGSDNIYIGAAGADESNTIRIGGPLQTTTVISGISGTTVPGGIPVFVNPNGLLGTFSSSARFKQDIHDMNDSSSMLLSLRPVRFRYKKEIDPSGMAQFGLVAEEVEKINPNLVVCDKDGKPYAVRYDQVNAMLLNEFLKEHKTVQEQGANIARLEKQIEVLTAGLQKVNAQLATASPSDGGLELSKPAPQTVLNLVLTTKAQPISDPN